MIERVTCPSQQREAVSGLRAASEKQTGEVHS